MDTLLHRAPSVGSLVKKILAVNPNLSAQQIIGIIRQATRTQGKLANEYASAEVVDEKLAMELAASSNNDKELLK
jgi:hypothetical protein